MVGNFEWRGPNDTFDRHFTTAGLDLTQKRIAKYLDLCDASGHATAFEPAQGGMVIARASSRFCCAAGTSNDAGTSCCAVGQG